MIILSPSYLLPKETNRADFEVKKLICKVPSVTYFSSVSLRRKNVTTHAGKTRDVGPELKEFRATCIPVTRTYADNITRRFDQVIYLHCYT